MLQHAARLLDEVHADNQHRAVHRLRVARRRVRSVGGDRLVAREQILAGDADAAEDEVAVVGAVVPHLRPDVAELDAGERRVRVEVAELDDKRVLAAVDAVEEEARHHHRVRRRLAEAARPPLRRRHRRRLEDEDARRRVVRRRRLERAQVGAVAELGLRVRADDRARARERQPLRALRVGAHQVDRRHEHPPVQPEAARLLERAALAVEPQRLERLRVRRHRRRPPRAQLEEPAHPRERHLERVGAREEVVVEPPGAEQRVGAQLGHNRTPRRHLGRAAVEQFGEALRVEGGGTALAGEGLGAG